MMRKGTSGGRRGFAVVAILIALAVMAPELAAPAGAATRPAARNTMTAAQKAKITQYIDAHPQVLTKHKKQLTTNRAGKLVKRKVKRRVSRKTRAANRKRAARRRRAKTKARSRKRRVRRGAIAAKGRAKKAKKGHKKKGATSTTTKMIHGIALIFLIGLPFIAVGLLLFGTDYRRRPRAVSNKKRRRVLVITPVGRKY